MSIARERCHEEIGKKVKRELADPPEPMARRTLLSSVGASPNTVTPCAACKLLRRRCAQECPFSPYFSPHEPQKFASVHKVFGASNVSKMLLEVPETQRADAANSLVYEANVRLRDPVYGCMGAITALQRQVQALEAELAAVRADILKHKFRQAGQAAALPAASAVHAVLLASSGQVSLAAAPPQPPVHGDHHPLLPHPQVAGRATVLSPATMYHPAPASSTDYSSITNENVAYFG
ncbi:LOB domain-containing protein 15 [Apostasia shenzhenica]|uniref:LOB domain-containing protein 15 n=1 Tax=Apostasia shenzhenica TaxID=1088818 RepID=A0A2I0BH52_9ASPA|nr:LOB domain-containing protein 15 [Apostasia shenzhenica]